jgi:hypothetical protein
MQLSAADIEKIDRAPMNFVVGKERSGTTLLQIMLNANPTIIAPPESRFIVLLYPHYGSIKKWTENNIKDFCNDLFKEALFTLYWDIEKDALIANLISVKERLTYSLLCKLVSYCNNPGKEVKVFIDKNPVYYYFLARLEKIFPDAKFIHLVRDYRGNITSHRRVFKIQDAAHLAYRWLKINQMIETRKAKNKARYFTLRYEDLVQEPEKYMSDLCSFLGVPYSENMIDNSAGLYDKFKNNPMQRFNDMHKHIFHPISTEQSNEWRNILPPESIAEAEAVAGKYGKEHYEYEQINPEKAGMPFLSLQAIKIKYSVIKVLYRVVFKNLALYYYVRNKIWKDF